MAEDTTDCTDDSGDDSSDDSVNIHLFESACDANDATNGFDLYYIDVDSTGSLTSNDTVDTETTTIDYSKTYYINENAGTVYSVTFSGDQTQGYTITVGNIAEDTADCTDDSSDD